MFVLALLAPCNVLAGDATTTIVMGQGINKSHSSAIYLVRIEGKLKDPRFGVRLDAGGYSDDPAVRKGALLTGVSVGRNIGSDNGFHGSLYMGVLFKTTNDALTSTNFQFTEDANICHSEVCIGYKHISNAGIKKPNIGRDYVTLGITLRFD